MTESTAGHTAADTAGRKGGGMLRRLGLRMSRIDGTEARVNRLRKDAEQAAHLREKLRDATEQQLREAAADHRSGPITVVAACAEAARRSTGMDLHLNQLQGALALGDRVVVELPTGEGKTVMIAVAAAAAAAGGRKVQIITANSYLAERDEEWMRPLYQMLGLTSMALNGEDDLDRARQAGRTDIVHTTAAAITSWRLKDEMADDQTGRALIPQDIAIVDEADAVLIDMAQAPSRLVVPRPVDEDRAGLWGDVASKLQVNDDDGEGGHFGYDERTGAIALSDAGWDQVEKLTGLRLYDEDMSDDAGALRDALAARTLYQKGREYIVEDEKIVLLDRRTGRRTAGSFQGGLQNAIEHKEGVPLTVRSITVAQVTLHRHFSRYTHLAGTSGSAEGAAGGLMSLYGLDLIVLPPDRLCVRRDLDDLVYRTAADRAAALVQEVQKRHAEGQPVLVGVDTLDDVTVISTLLDDAGVPHRTLSAANPSEEAAVMATAGHSGQVTVATRMAGRGVDIVLGDSPEDAARVKAAGGLCVLGAQRFETRRADGQLRGRAGRQGDPGESRFLLSLDDELLRPFSRGTAGRAIVRLTDADGTGTGHPTLTKLVARSQQELTDQADRRRASMMRYDSIVENQRETLLKLRERILTCPSCAEEGRPRLSDVDRAWADHLHLADTERQAAWMRSLGKVDPAGMYEKEIDTAFRTMMVGLGGHPEGDCRGAAVYGPDDSSPGEGGQERPDGLDGGPEGRSEGGLEVRGR